MTASRDDLTYVIYTFFPVFTRYMKSLESFHMVYYFDVIVEYTVRCWFRCKKNVISQLCGLLH